MEELQNKVAMMTQQLADIERKFSDLELKFTDHRHTGRDSLTIEPQKLKFRHSGENANLPEGVLYYDIDAHRLKYRTNNSTITIN